MKIYRLNQAEFRMWRDHALRTELIKKIHTDRGPTQVRAPSGVILGTARGTTERIPLERARIRGAHHAVSPGECVCREWQKPQGKEDQHHPICRLKSAWEAQLAHSPDLPRKRAILTVESPKDSGAAAPTKAESASTPPRAAMHPEPEPNEPNPASASVPAAVPSTSKPVRVLTPAPDPADCACHDWAAVEDGKHHRICEFRERWEREHNIPAPLLVELETGEVAREATPDEAAASKAKALEDGIGAIELSDGHHYYVRQP